MRVTLQRTSVFVMVLNGHAWNCRALVCAIALALNVPATAGQFGESPTSLAGAVEQAWRLNPQAAGMDARDAEANASKDLAGSLTPEPLAISVGNLNDRQGNNTGKQEWEVELAVPLWLPGQKEARGTEAESRLAETAARRAAIRLEVAGEVREAWWSLAAARAGADLSARRVDTARALNADVQKRFKVGELSRIDANLARGEVLAAEAEMVDAQSVLLQAEQTFRLLTGGAIPANIVEERLTRERDPLGTSGSAEPHPKIAAAAAVARSARARLKLSEEQRRAAPELTLRALRERGDSTESYDNIVGVKLKIPFYSGPQVRRDTSAAQAEAEQADAEMRRAEMRGPQEVERARRALEGAERQLSMASERRFLAIDNLKLAEKSFSLGESDLATLLRIRAAAFESENAYDRQRIARMASISRLNQALGVMP